MTTTAPAATCEICSGRGEVAPGARCPVCEGTGTATPEAAAAHRELLTQAAVAGALEGARRGGAAAARQAARAQAQAVTDAQQAALRATQAAAEARGHSTAPLEAAQAVLARAEAAAGRAERAAAQIQAAAVSTVTPPDPTDPPPGAPIPPGFGAGDVFYFDSILARQVDVWGALNVIGGGSLMTNPMTALGDLITGGAGGTPTRLPVGANGTVLTVSGGVPAWAAFASGNPMTTLGDMITGGAGGVQTRLGVGAAGQVLTVSGGVPTWQNNAAGFANPMTTAGDLITGGAAGAAQRLAIGANGQVLGVSGGAVGWVNNPAGFANPMTTQGDLIVGGTAGHATRLAAPSTSQILTSSGGGLGWVAAPVIVMPSGDATGATDAANFATAISALPNGGLILAGPGQFTVNGAKGINLPAQTTSGILQGNPVSLVGCGSATTIGYVGSGSCIFYHRTQGYGGQFGQAADMRAGFIKDLIIDGTNSVAGATGLDVGDGWGYDIDVTVTNYAGAGSIGAWIINRVFWTEKGKFIIHAMNNDTAVQIDTTGSVNTVSHEYCDYWIYIFANGTNATSRTQNGIVIAGGTNAAGCTFFIRGNFGANTAAPGAGLGALVVTGSTTDFSTYSRIFQSDIFMKVEGNGPGNFVPGILLAAGPANNGNIIKQCAGRISHSVGNSQLNGNEFSFHGTLYNDTNLTNGWPSTAFPGLGVAWDNTGPDALVCISGGTLTNITIAGTITGLLAGAFYIPAGGALTVNGTVAPTVWNVVPAAQTGQ